MDDPEFGHFEGSVQADWGSVDRKMTLLEDFAYLDPADFRWSAPRGSVIDGASIPRILWPIVGSPFTGEYRRASVVHDVACVVRDEPWRRVHRMFYNACRCGGVSEPTAKLLYGGVYYGGPRWIFGVGLQPLEPLQSPPELAESDIEALRAFIDTSSPSLDEIENFFPSPPITTIVA